MHGSEPSDGSATGIPSWVKDAVFYQIFPDRFAKSDLIPKPSNLEAWDSPPSIYGFKGGDLLGVAERLDYLQELGVTALYLCPIFQSTANHRYHTYDYYSVDPILGGNDAFQHLLHEAHTRSMRVVLDGVFNHCSRGFFQFNHILENGADSPYLDWFTVYKWPLVPYGPNSADIGYWAWWGNPALPKFKTSNPAVREYLLQVGEYWIKQGIDGWRLDVPNEIDDDSFWQEFRKRVKRVNPDAYIVGEIWGDAGRWLQGDQFDAVMNYPFAKAALGFFAGRNGLDAGAIGGTGLDPVRILTAEEFGRDIETLLHRYPDEITQTQLNLLDSHDTARFIRMVCGDESALRLAMLFQYTFVGAPCTYYGDEIGMAGGNSVESARGGFEWDVSKWNTGFFDYARACMALRHAYPALRRGSYESLFAGSGAYAFARRSDDGLVAVALNTAAEPRQFSISLPPGVRLQELRSVWGDGALAQGTGSSATWRVPPRQASVFVSSVANPQT